jgi:hypothetical protein
MLWINNLIAGQMDEGNCAAIMEDLGVRLEVLKTTQRTEKMRKDNLIS